MRKKKKSKIFWEVFFRGKNSFFRAINLVYVLWSTYSFVTPYLIFLGNHLLSKLSRIFSFINNYGTHYISSATIGSLYGEQSLISRESYFEMITKGIDVELYAGFSAIGSINPSFDYNQTESETFKKVPSI